MAESRLRLLVGMFVVWSVVTIGVMGQMAFNYAAVGSYDTSCPIGDSSGGPSHWQWWLPHGVCDYPLTSRRGSDVLAGLARVFVPLCWLVLLGAVIVGLTTHIRAQLRGPADTSDASASRELTAR